MKAERKMSTCNQLDLESQGSCPRISAQKLPGHCLKGQMPAFPWFGLCCNSEEPFPALVDADCAPVSPISFTFTELEDNS